MKYTIVPASSSVGADKIEDRGKLHGRRLGRAQTRDLRHQMKCDFFLRDLGDEKELFYSLVVAKTIEGRPAMGRWLRHSSMVVGVASSDALASETISAVAVTTGSPPPSRGSTRDALARLVGGRTLGD
jgi:hypothetical protein